MGAPDPWQVGQLDELNTRSVDRKDRKSLDKVRR
jgi:hypothetical protein